MRQGHDGAITLGDEDSNRVFSGFTSSVQERGGGRGGRKETT